MATHSSVLAWKIPWTEEPGGLQSRGVGKSQTELRAAHQLCTEFYQVSRFQALKGAD